MGDTGDVLVRPLSAADAPFSLYCFPHAGGGVAAWTKWAQALAPAVDTIAVRLPGRESRYRERRYTRMVEVVKAVAPAVARDITGPYGVIGHSTGALMAFEVLHALQRADIAPPRAAIFAGHRAPHLPSASPRLGDMSDAAVTRLLAIMGGTPSVVLENQRLMAALLPAIRADYEIDEFYQYREQTTLVCPLWIFVGSSDPVLSAAQARFWAFHTQLEFEIRIFDGGHFFLHDNLSAASSAVIDILTGRAGEPQ